MFQKLNVRQFNRRQYNRRRRMKKLCTILLGLILIALLLQTMSCQSQPKPPASSPVPVVPSKKIDYKKVVDIAGNSACAGYSFKDRGHAPVGYMKGVAQVYARALCNRDRADVKVMAQKKTGDSVHDALTWYDVDDTHALRKTFALLIGLGLRESSGKYCCGRDMSASFSSDGSAEAGAWQGSWGSRRASAVLEPMFRHYQADQSGCLLDVFKEGVKTCGAGDFKNWGDPSSDGYKWQALAKSCPAFAAEWTAVLLRTLGGSHGEFGPTRRKAAEIVSACEAMLIDVEKAVDADVSLCG